MTAGDVLSRSTDNVLANWEALLLEIGVSLVATLAFTLVALAAVMPMALEPRRAPVTVIVVLTCTLLLVLLLRTGVTSFATAATARIYIDGARTAAAAPEVGRAAYRSFSFPAWKAAGKAMWARVFGVQVAVGAVIVIVVGLPFLLMMMLPKGVSGCVGCVVLPLILAAVLVISIWSRKAVVIAVDRGSGVEESLGAAWRDIAARLGEHLVPLLAIGVLTWVASCVLFVVATAAGGCWSLAALVALEKPR